MSILKNENNEITIENVKSSSYEVPAVLKEEKEEISFEKALFCALILHPLIVLLILASSFILKLLGIDFNLFHKPDIHPKDIEFVLVDKEGTPIDKNTKNRADKNSRAGGKHDPKRPVSMPQESAPKSPDKKPTSPAPAKKVEQPKVKQPQQKAQPQVQKPAAPQTPSKPAPQQPVQQPKTQAPKPTAPKPTVTPSKSAPRPNPSSNFNIPMPKSAIPVTQPSSAPVTSAPSAQGSSGGSSGRGKSSPSPSFLPTNRGGSGAGGTGKGSGGGGRFSNGTGNGRGNAGNPGPGNPNGTPGIDAIKEPDFGPYMKELQRRIKMNWDPPKGNESKRVVLLFSIARDGRLLNVKVHKSSGLQNADNAAINAVKLTAPFRPLPPEFKGDKVDIQFTFDYTVFGINGY